LKLIENLHWLNKLHKELFISEKKQISEYANLLKNKLSDIRKEYELEYIFPG
jgi:hypothetical protein